MVAPEYVDDGSYWDNTDDAEMVIPRTPAADEEPRVIIPEIPEDHHKALVTSAFGLLLMTGAVAATTRYIKRRKAGE